jgi:hypothetical protein
MNPCLVMLRARDQATRHPQEPSKPSKPIMPVVTDGDTTAEKGFEGFEGDRDRDFSRNEPATKAAEQITLDRLWRTVAHLKFRCPDLVPNDHWREAIQDSRRFLVRWGAKAERLGWTVRDLFGLAPMPDKPHPRYWRLSRYDETGLSWLLRGRPVLALTENSAAVMSPSGAVTIYRRHNRPALGPLVTR